MRGGAAPAEPEPRRRLVEGATARAAVTAVQGGAFAAGSVIAGSVLLGLIVSFLISGYGAWTWVKVGLLTAVLGLRADAAATFRGPPLLRAADAAAFRWRIVPMLVTIGFLVLEARAGRRSAEERPGGRVAPTVAIAATAAAIPAAALAALASIPVFLSFPGLGVRLHVDIGTAAISAALLAAAGAAVGAFLRSARGRPSAAILRGGLVGYGWALVLILAATAVVAALEPGATRAYAGFLGDRGSAGALIFVGHLLALPAQSALLLAPATGSCLRVAADAPGLSLCPWELSTAGPAAALIGSIRLTPWLWIMDAAAPVAASFAGRAAARETGGTRPVVVGAAAGVLFGMVAAGAALVVAPTVVGDLPLLASTDLSIRPDLLPMAFGGVGWGIAGGALGGWLERRRYGVRPVSARRTSA